MSSLEFAVFRWISLIFGSTLMAMTDEAKEGWALVARLLQARLDILMRSIAELEQTSGVSFKTWKRALAGEPITRRDKRRQIAVAVGWTADSIDRILRGEEPTDRAIAQVTEIEGRLAELATDYYTDRAISRPQFFAASERLSSALMIARRHLSSVSRASVEVPDDVRADWAGQSFDVQRAAVEGLIAKVEIGPGVRGLNRFDHRRVSITWREHS